MKTRFFSLFVLCFCAVTLNAQMQLATLNHNDSISIFYGGYGLRDAHNAAVSGDIITLSPGAFQSVDLTKAVRIHGAGMISDTIAGTQPTVILGDFKINIPNDSAHYLYMEGLSCVGEIAYQTIYYPQFIKCYFKEFDYYSSGSSAIMANATFINCIISRFDNAGGSNGSYARSPQFVNCVILDNSNSSTWSYGNWLMVNCIAYINPGHLTYGSVQNCIVYYSNGSSSTNAYSVYYSLGVNTGSSNIPIINGTGLSYHYNYNYNGYASVFKTFRGTWNEGITFELQDSIAAKCLGGDGTQVGIYGGQVPFDPSVRNPYIKKVNVAPRSNAEGKLPVDIEIVSE